MTQLSDSSGVRNDIPAADQSSVVDISASPRDAGLLVLIAAMPVAQSNNVIAGLRESFASTNLFIATAGEVASEQADPSRSVISLTAASSSWPLSAADFVNASQIAEEKNLRSILMLGPESGSFASTAIYNLASAVMDGSSDLAMPCYDLPPHAGLVNSAILFPVARSLFASSVRFPLAIDLGLSLRMAERLELVAKSKSGNLGDMLLWPVSEASAGGFTIHEVNVGKRVLPQPQENDFNSIFTQVIGSLFADVEVKAPFWQRARRLPPPRQPMSSRAEADGTSDIVRMIEAFRFANTNLQEIWALVLSPNSLVGLKRLSVVNPAEFRMPETLWSRVVFDFLIAYKLRVINRGHLLGALIPIYLAWVAGHINVTLSGTNAEQHIEAVAAAFEADKPYLVSRWRWPDRFNS